MRTAKLIEVRHSLPGRRQTGWTPIVVLEAADAASATAALRARTPAWTSQFRIRSAAGWLAERKERT
jgi:hypothetical protein